MCLWVLPEGQGDRMIYALQLVGRGLGDRENGIRFPATGSGSSGVIRPDGDADHSLSSVESGA